MRHAILVLVALLLAPSALAQAGVMEHSIFLHENPLHALPEIINADDGATLKFTVENPEAPGKTPHNLMVCAEAPKPAESCANENVWARSGMIAPGASAPLTFEATRAGTFEYYCFIPGHKGAGMSGTLVVQGAAEEKGMPGIPVVAILLTGFAAALLLRRVRA